MEVSEDAQPEKKDGRSNCSWWTVTLKASSHRDINPDGDERTREVSGVL